MSRVAVVTDSTASLPETLMKELNIRTVAYYLHRGHEILRDLVTIQRDDFLRWLPTARVAPTTAAPGPGDYLQAYEELADQGAEEIISIHMSSKISAAYESASAASGLMREKRPGVCVEVIDSRNAALCQGWMAVEAARQALAGASLQTIAAAVRRLVPISHMIQTADTLRYLYLGGRIGKAQTLLGSLLNIKPLIGIEDGVIVPLGRTTAGTRPMLPWRISSQESSERARRASAICTRARFRRRRRSRNSWRRRCRSWSRSLANYHQCWQCTPVPEWQACATTNWWIDRVRLSFEKAYPSGRRAPPQFFQSPVVV